MALDINGYNSAFQQFVQFAQENRNVDKGKAILDAKIDSPLGGRKILSIGLAKNDSVHNWTRGFDQWTVNDRTRAIFKAAVANMFGGESKIPESVRKAMVLDDYNCGKPLTARRILAVKAAIDADGTAKARSAAFAEATSAATKSIKSLSRTFDPGQVAASAKAALAAAAADPDAVKIVAKRLKGILRRADATVRPPDDAGKKAKAILANVEELRAATKGNRFLYDAGLKFLDLLEGKALPPGAIKDIFAHANGLSLKAFKSAKPGAGPAKLHAAFVFFLKAADAAVNKFAAALTDTNERLPFRFFFGQLLASKLDHRTLRNLHDALHGDDGRTLLLFYRDILKVNWGGVDDNKVEKMNELATKYKMQMDQFDGAIAQALGIDLDNYDGIDATGKMEHEGAYVADIGNDLLDTVNEAAKAVQK